MPVYSSLVLSAGLLLSFGAMREPSSLPDGMAAVCKYQAALFPPYFPGDYQHCINTEVLSTEHTQTAHHHKTHTHTIAQSETHTPASFYTGCGYIILIHSYVFSADSRGGILYINVCMLSWLGISQKPSVCVLCGVIAFINPAPAWNKATLSGALFQSCSSPS